MNRGRPGGRTQEIQRLIGRSLRSVTDLSRLGERTITVDCDVLQADAGTRTASITGGYIALALALRGLEADGKVPGDLLADSVAAVSVGIVDGEAAPRPLLRGGRRRRGRLQRRDDRRRATSSRCRARPRARRSRVSDLDAMLDLAAAGVARASPRCSATRWPAEATAVAFPERLAIASRNAHKLRELGRICADWPVELGDGRESRPARRSPRSRRRATPTSTTPC